MMLPDLERLASVRERSFAYGLIMLAGAYCMLQSARLAAKFGNQTDLTGVDAPSVGGFAMTALLALLLRLQWRATQPALVAPRAAE